MEQAYAGADAQGVSATHALSNSHIDGTNGSLAEKHIEYTTPRPIGSSKRSKSSRNGGGVEDIALCASPAGFATRKQKGHTETESIGGLLRQAMVNHQLGISLNLILLVALTYLLFPSLRDRVGAFFTLQYPTGQAGEFSLGPKDTYLVVGYVVLFTGLRAACMDYALLPLASMLGIRNKKTKVRCVRDIRACFDLVQC